MSNNRSTGEAFRLKVVIAALRAGLPAVMPQDTDSPLHSRLGDTDAHSDIGGLSPWVVHVRSSATGNKLSEVLAEASAAAAEAGSDWPLAVMSRPGHPVEDSYAVIPLHVAFAILRGETPRPPRPVDGIGG